jgi:hypothetical protein
MEGSKVVGKVPQDQLDKLSKARSAAQAVQFHIGSLEVTKARLLTQISDLEDDAAEVMAEIARDLGVADGVPYQITKDGELILQG